MKTPFFSVAFALRKRMPWIAPVSAAKKRFLVIVFGGVFVSAGFLFGEQKPIAPVVGQTVPQNPKPLGNGQQAPIAPVIGQAVPQNPKPQPAPSQPAGARHHIPGQTMPQDGYHHDDGGDWWRGGYRPWRPYGYYYLQSGGTRLGPYVYFPYYPYPNYPTPYGYSPPYAQGYGNLQAPNIEGQGSEASETDSDKPPAIERGTNPQSVAKGWKFIGYGDALFHKQKYREALDRYRMAAQAAPQLGDALFRQGFAHAALGHYDLAAKALKRGLDIDPKLVQSEFKLEDLYSDDDVKKNHIEALAKDAENNPANADQLFILGVYLHFDRQQDRAKLFFQRAAEKSRGDVDAINAFLRE